MRRIFSSEMQENCKMQQCIGDHLFQTLADFGEKESSVTRDRWNGFK